MWASAATIGNCTCYCQRAFSGNRCQNCATGYLAPACQQCDVGYAEPNCMDACTSEAVSCNNNVIAPFPVGMYITGGKCVCVCKSNFAGEKCERCAAGYENFAAGCHEACTDPKISCYNNATSVSGVYPYC